MPGHNETKIIPSGTTESAAMVRAAASHQQCQIHTSKRDRRVQMSPVGRQMQNRTFGFYLLCSVIAALGTILATSVAAAQVADGPWMNPKLSPEERADMVLKQLTLDEKL